MPKLVALFWDLDDTLTLTTAARLRAQQSMIQAALAALPAADRPPVAEVAARLDRLVALFGSTYYPRHISLLCQELEPDPARRRRLIKAARRAYRDAFWQMQPAPKAVETLGQLAQQGYTLGLVSNGLYPLQLQKLACTGLAPCFDPAMIFVSSRYRQQFDLPPGLAAETAADTPELESTWLDSGVEKPWPWLLRQALAACNCPARRAVYVGNRASDVVSARLAGVWSVSLRAAPPVDPPPILALEQPDFALNHIAEIFSVINQIEAR